MGSNPSKKSSGTTAPSSDDDEQFDGDGHLLGAGAHDTADGTGGLDEATSSGSEYYTDSESEEGMEGSRHGGHGSATLGSEGEDYSFSGSGSHDGSGESACSTDEEERMWVVVDPPESSLRTIQPQPGSELELSNAAATLEAALCFALVQSPGGASLPGALQARFQPTRFGGGAADALVQQMVRRMVRGCMWGGFTRWVELVAATAREEEEEEEEEEESTTAGESRGEGAALADHAAAEHAQREVLAQQRALLAQRRAQLAQQRQDKAAAAAVVEEDQGEGGEKDLGSHAEEPEPQPGSELELSNAAATLEAALCFALVQSPGGASLPGALQARFQPTRFGGGAADALVQQMVRRMVRGCMWGGFTRWAAWAGRRRRLRELGVSAVARLRQRLSHRGWGGWLDGVAAQRQERRAVQMLARLTQQGLCCAVRGWRDHVLTLQRQRAIMRRVTVQLQQRSLGAAWGSWVDFVEAVHEAAREAVRSAAVRLPCRHP
jgi:hypothetical protein